MTEDFRQFLHFRMRSSATELPFKRSVLGCPIVQVLSTVLNDNNQHLFIEIYSAAMRRGSARLQSRLCENQYDQQQN